MDRCELARGLPATKRLRSVEPRDRIEHCPVGGCREMSHIGAGVASRQSLTPVVSLLRMRATRDLVRSLSEEFSDLMAYLANEIFRRM